MQEDPKKSFVFFPDLISKETEDEFLKNVSSTTCEHAEWTSLKKRRLILAGACPPGPNDNNNQQQKEAEAEAKKKKPQIPSWMFETLLESVNSKLPSHIKKFAARSCSCYGSSPSEREQEDGKESQEEQEEEDNNKNKLNILLNEYKAPSGIMLHTDAAGYLETVAIVSMSSCLPICFTPRADSNIVSELYEKEQQEKSMKKEKESSNTSSSSLYDDDQQDGDEDEEDLMIPEWMKRQKLFDSFLNNSDLISPLASAKFGGGKKSSSLTLERVQRLQDVRLAHPDSFAVLLPPRSLIVFFGTLYSEWMHGILEGFVDVIPRRKIANFDLLMKSTSSFSEQVKLTTTKESFQLLSEIKNLKSLNENLAGTMMLLLQQQKQQQQEEKEKEQEELFINVRKELRVSMTYRRIK